MKKIIPYWFLLICLTALARYPSRTEIMTFFIVGSGLFLFLAFGVCKIMDDYEFTKKKYSMKNIIGFSLPVLVVIYGIYFLNIFIVSLFEKRIVMNLLQTGRGKAYMAIDLGFLILFILYYGLFYFRNRRWPTMEKLIRK